MNITKEQLLEYVTLCPEQGYALYFEENGEALECYHGPRELDKPEILIDADSNFRLASVTKQFIGHGIRALVDAGKLSYDTELQALYEDLPEYLQKITIMDLLNHLSGIRNYDDDGNTLHMDRQLVDEDVLEFLRLQKDGYTPARTVYRYSNSAYVLLGLIIEKISGQCIEEFMKENVFLPFGMLNTNINRQGVSKIPNRVYGTAYVDGKLIQRDQGRTSATIGDGAVYSSVHDLRIYLDKFQQLDLEKIYQPRSQADAETEYSKGIRALHAGEHTIWYHSGGTTGTHNLVGCIPDLGIKFIFLSNIDGIDASNMLKSIRAYIGA